MKAIMGEQRRHCQTCDGTGGELVANHPSLHRDCPECRGNGYVIVVAAVDRCPDCGGLAATCQTFAATKASE